MVVNFNFFFDKDRLYFSQTNVFDSERKFVLSSKLASGCSINLRHDKWWTGNKFVGSTTRQPIEVSFCNIGTQGESEQHEKWLTSLRSGEEIIGPFDTDIVSSNFFFVGTEREQFWVYVLSPTRLLTYNPFWTKTNGEYKRYEGWIRFFIV